MKVIKRFDFTRLDILVDFGCAFTYLYWLMWIMMEYGNCLFLLALLHFWKSRTRFGPVPFYLSALNNFFIWMNNQHYCGTCQGIETNKNEPVHDKLLWIFFILISKYILPSQRCYLLCCKNYFRKNTLHSKWINLLF